MQNFKHLASLCCCAVRFEHDLVENPQNRFIMMRPVYQNLVQGSVAQSVDVQIDILISMDCQRRCGFDSLFSHILLYILMSPYNKLKKGSSQYEHA